MRPPEDTFRCFAGTDFEASGAGNSVLTREGKATRSNKSTKTFPDPNHERIRVGVSKMKWPMATSPFLIVTAAGTR